MLKIIHLSGLTKEYSDISELAEEFKKRNIKLGDGCTLGERCMLGDGCKLGERCTLANWCTLGERCTLGDDCTLGDYCKLGDRSTLGDDCTLGEGCTLGDDCTLGDYCKLGDDCTLGDGVLITKHISIYNFYKYVAAGFETEEGIKWIQLGCRLRTVEDWENDFWNNPHEFPEGSKAGKKRLHAYNTIKAALNA